MSKSSELDIAVKKYILDCMDFDDYGIVPKTQGESIEALRQIFHDEAGWNIERIGEVAALREWYSGLPTCCTVAYTNMEIIDLAILWGSLPVQHTEKQADKIVNNWFNLVAVKTMQLFHGYRVPKILAGEWS